jgi:multiple sugar transport system substrate-binding protein
MWKTVAKLTGTGVLAIAASSLLAQDLSVWHTENDRATIAALDTIARRFEAENPGVKVQMLSVGWDDLYRKLTLAIQSRDVPVVTQIEPFMAAYLYNSGQLQPLDDIVETLNKPDIFPAVLDLQMFDGKTLWHRHGARNLLLLFSP